MSLPLEWLQKPTRKKVFWKRQYLKTRSVSYPHLTCLNPVHRITVLNTPYNIPVPVLCIVAIIQLHCLPQNTMIKQAEVQKYHYPWSPHTYQLLRVITCWVKFKIITSSEYSSMNSSMKGWYSEAHLMTSKDKKYALLWKRSFFSQATVPCFCFEN